MRRTLFVTAACVVLAASAAFAGGYVGLFADDTHGTWCVAGVGFYPVEMWVWALPGELGMVCVEYTVEYPANVIRSTVTFPDDVPRLAGDLVDGLSLCFFECRYDWCWIAHQSLWVTDTARSVLRIGPHPDVGGYRFANCEPGYPFETFTRLTNLYVNYAPEEPECGATAAETASWGAIKGMLE